ncbi:flagellar basal body L-ring protein FlgH [Endozoicomonas sp. OPT23]|uniref:flagellar basal body L-ring protein FlgH n=1 Tax=Endozoicomonas sp. OPT23 TaxID=2072845 RepID=UPI00129A9FAA|nr:flagellar basal body L-ring protein FlgH [Endozoicomonas sp. OPT23]MRI33927.1 flagellar basal body L-ring protein FlgH [Endozoicomonas sp. OPT23]
MIRYLLPVVLFLAGCSGVPLQKKDSADWAPPPLPEPEARQAIDGSLYNPVYANNLFADRMAYQVGDILTVKLDEKTRSSKSAGTSLKKDNKFELPIPKLWGTVGKESKIDLKRDFNGKGSSSQENMLSGSITVSVVKVLANGALVVRGEKGIRLNQGDEFIRISGILRPEDITPDNTVSSQRLANARISYSGEGSVAEVNAQGWLSRAFNHPLFPM